MFGFRYFQNMLLRLSLPPAPEESSVSKALVLREGIKRVAAISHVVFTYTTAPLPITVQKDNVLEL